MKLFNAEALNSLTNRRLSAASFEKKSTTLWYHFIVKTKKGWALIFRVEALVSLEAKQDPTPYHDVQKHEHDLGVKNVANLASNEIYQISTRG